MEESAKEMSEAVTEREKSARFSEVKGYLRAIETLLEREQNETFRTAPRNGLRRALLRWNVENPGDTPI
jgi:hypothetical protein